MSKLCVLANKNQITWLTWLFTRLSARGIEWFTNPLHFLCQLVHSFLPQPMNCTPALFALFGVSSPSLFGLFSFSLSLLCPGSANFAYRLFPILKTWPGHFNLFLLIGCWSFLLCSSSCSYFCIWDFLWPVDF